MWAALLLLAAVLRHLAGEGPAHAAPPPAPMAQMSHANLAGHDGCVQEIASADKSLSPGAAWAAKEEARFTRARCC